MNSVYSTVIAFILLAPWTVLGVTAAGYLRARWRRRSRPA